MTTNFRDISVSLCLSRFDVSSISGELKTLSVDQNGHQIADDIFKCISLNGNINITTKFVPISLFDNESTLASHILIAGKKIW